MRKKNCLTFNETRALMSVDLNLKRYPLSWALL